MIGFTTGDVGYEFVGVNLSAPRAFHKKIKCLGSKARETCEPVGLNMEVTSHTHTLANNKFVGEV